MSPEHHLRRAPFDLLRFPPDTRAHSIDEKGCTTLSVEDLDWQRLT